MDLVRPLRHSEPRSHPTGQPLSSGLHGPSPRGAGGLANHRLSRLTNHLRFRSSGWKLFVVFVLVLGVAISAASASAWYAYVSSQRRRAAASSLGSVKSILAAILSRLDPSQHYPGSIAFAYVESVSRAGLPEFEAVTQRDPPLAWPARTGSSGRTTGRRVIA